MDREVNINFSGQGQKVFIVSVLATKRTTVAVETLSAEQMELRHFPFISLKQSREEAREEAMQKAREHFPEAEGWELGANALAITLEPRAERLEGQTAHIVFDVRVPEQ